MEVFVREAWLRHEVNLNQFDREESWHKGWDKLFLLPVFIKRKIKYMPAQDAGWCSPVVVVRTAVRGGIERGIVDFCYIKHSTVLPCRQVFGFIEKEPGTKQYKALAKDDELCEEILPQLPVEYQIS